MNTALFTDMNWLAVLTASVAYFALGGLWYSLLFSKQWIAYQNINVDDPEMKKGVAGIMLTTFVLLGVSVICLAVLVNRLEPADVLSGVKLGLLTGVGFAATAISINYLYTKKPIGLHLIDGLYYVTGNILAAIILTLWQ